MTLLGPRRSKLENTVTTSGAEEPKFVEKAGEVTQDGSVQWINTGKSEQKKQPMSPGKQYWHFISGKDARSGQVYGKGGSRSGLSHRQMESYLRNRAQRSTRPSEETILATILSIVFSNTRIEEAKKQKGKWFTEVVKPGKISSGLR